MKKKELKSVVREMIEKVNSIDKRLNALEQRNTPEEIESTLIEEAIKRGHKYDVYSWNHEQNTLYGHRGNDVGHDILFENGVWSKVKPEENKTLSIEDIEKKVVKFAESVDWDFDKVNDNIDASDDVINWEEYNLLKGEYSSGENTIYIR